MNSKPACAGVPCCYGYRRGSEGLEEHVLYIATEALQKGEETGNTNSKVVSKKTGKKPNTMTIEGKYSLDPSARAQTQPLYKKRVQTARNDG